MNVARPSALAGAGAPMRQHLFLVRLTLTFLGTSTKICVLTQLAKLTVWWTSETEESKQCKRGLEEEEMTDVFYSLRGISWLIPGVYMKIHACKTIRGGRRKTARQRQRNSLTKPRA